VLFNCQVRTTWQFFDTMKVFVKLYAAFRQHHPGPNRSVPLEVEMAEGAVASDLAAALKLPAGLLRSVFINNAAATPDTVLHEGDQVGLFPPVVGGGA
jgi:molybdopterin converting factor small subunit